ncbi:unnamed protein product [Lactuca saligna]|uniref:DDE Tnp4 domain-containing protein n=1 Tax=Lactuca saligna TaxID=75948 RepID=A0AA36EM36_LACSI|nr:unnamed protein product [Lactuca saligna]
MAIVTKFPDFREGSNEFSQALFVFTKKQNREAFMFPTTDEAKMRMDSDDSNSSNDNEEWWVEEDRQFKMLCGLALKGIILARNDCIGAIDGTHVRASVPQNEEAKYIGRKGYATQNIMVVCDFNMCFTFVWVGWERTAHNTRIFSEALQRPDLNFSYPTGDKYYVVDAGYPNTRGYLAPYKGTNIRYHLPDFRRGHSAAVREPRGPKEKFNYLHSSLRNIIKRTFGVWKARWALLRDMHVNYKYKNQIKIVIASMAIHNYIRKFGRFDETFNMAQQESYNPIRSDTSSEVYEKGPSTRRTSGDNLYMAAIRDIIAQDINTLQRRM